MVRIILVVCLIIVGISPSRAAAPTRAAKAPPAPVSVNIRTATDRQSPSGTKICMPTPSPKRSVTMKEFASWVRAEASRKDEVASAAFLRFMAGRFPCT
jgi:hypothetical protein